MYIYGVLDMTIIESLYRTCLSNGAYMKDDMNWNFKIMWVLLPSLIFAGISSESCGKDSTSTTEP